MECIPNSLWYVKREIRIGSSVRTIYVKRSSSIVGDSSAFFVRVSPHSSVFLFVLHFFLYMFHSNLILPLSLENIHMYNAYTFTLDATSSIPSNIIIIVPLRSLMDVPRESRWKRTPCKVHSTSCKFNTYVSASVRACVCEHILCSEIQSGFERSTRVPLRCLYIYVCVYVYVRLCVRRDIV